MSEPPATPDPLAHDGATTDVAEPAETGERETPAIVRWSVPVGRSHAAIAAGYAGLFSLILFPAPFALLLGALAIRDIRKHPEKSGMGRAVFGLVMGALGTIALVYLTFLAP